MVPLKIARRDYRQAAQPALATFAGNVLTRMHGVAAYEALQPSLELLTPQLEAYRHSLAAAQNRGRSEIVAKNLAQAALLVQLEELATALEKLAQGDHQLIVDAGFSIGQIKSSSRLTGPLPTPVITQASSTGKRGEVRIRLADPAPRSAVATYAVEYSLEREAGWQNGHYHTHRNFVADALPRAEALWLRLRSLGHANKRSEWSEPFMVAVL